MPLIYEAVKLDCGFRADLVVEGRVVVETKCKECLHPVDEAQLLSHLRLLNISVGLLINFHVLLLLKDGIRRMVNHYRDPDEETSYLHQTAKKLLTAKGAATKSLFSSFFRDLCGFSLRPWQSSAFAIRQ